MVIVVVDGDGSDGSDGSDNGDVWDVASATKNVYNTLLMMLKVGSEVLRCNRGPLAGEMNQIYLQCSGLFQSADWCCVFLQNACNKSRLQLVILLRPSWSQKSCVMFQPMTFRYCTWFLGLLSRLYPWLWLDYTDFVSLDQPETSINPNS